MTPGSGICTVCQSEPHFFDCPVRIQQLVAERDVLREAVTTIGTVIDRGIPDERKLTVVRRIVDGAA